MVDVPNLPGAAKIDYVHVYKDDGYVDLTLLTPIIDVHSDIDISSSFCTITIIDFDNFLGRSYVTAGHTIEFEVTQSGSTIKRTYVIQSIKDISNYDTGRKYEITGVSHLRYVSNYKIVSKAYSDTTSNIAAAIFQDFTKEKVFHWEPSQSVQELVIPSYSPIDAIRWLASRSQSPTSVQAYRFFQDSRQRYSFMSLPKAREIWGDNGITYRYRSNLSSQNGVPNTQAELTEILNLEFIRAIDMQQAILDGQISNTRFTLDFTTRTLDIDTNNYWDTYSKDALNNKTLFREDEMGPGKYTYKFLADYSTNIPGRNNARNQVHFSYGDFYHQQIEIIVHGNTSIDIGQVIKIEIPEPKAQAFEIDYWWSGKYICLAKRDRYDAAGHKMVLRLGKDSLK